MVFLATKLYTYTQTYIQIYFLSLLRNTIESVEGVQIMLLIYIDTSLIRYFVLFGCYFVPRAFRSLIGDDNRYNNRSFGEKVYLGSE